MSYTGLLDQTDVEWMGLMLHNQDPTKTETRADFIMPVAGQIGGLRVVLSAAPGAGNSYNFTVRKNVTNTSLGFTISGTDTSGEDYANIVDFVAGDLLNIQITPTSSPTLASCRFYILISADSAVLLCNDGETSATGLGASSTHSLAVMGTVSVGVNVGVTGDQEDGGTVCPSDGTITTMYVQLETAPGIGDTRSFTLYVNDVATALVVTISGNSITGSAVSSVSISAGDKLFILAQRSGGINTPSTFYSIGMDFTPGVADEFPYMSSCLVDPAGAQLQDIASEIQFHATTNGSLSPGISTSTMYVLLQAAPGGSETRTVTLWQNGVDTTTTLTLTGATASGNFAGSVAYAENDTIEYELGESSGSAADPLNVRIGLKTVFTGRSPFVSRPMRFYSRTPNAEPFIFSSLSSEDPMIFSSRTV